MGRKCTAQEQLKTWGLPPSAQYLEVRHITHPLSLKCHEINRGDLKITTFSHFFLSRNIFFLARQTGLNQTMLSRGKT